MSEFLVPHSRFFKKFISFEDTFYEHAVKGRNSSTHCLAYGIKVPHIFHRSQMKCFELLVQHYWLCQIRSVPPSKRKPVPMLIKVAFSWIVEEDKTYIEDSAFRVSVDQFMHKRVASWTHLCINKPFPGCPDPKLSQFLPVYPEVEDSESLSKNTHFRLYQK